MEKKAITMADVARKARVSVTAVSYVLNDKSSISAQTKARVWKVIQELRYQPNDEARRLGRKNGSVNNPDKKNRTILFMLHGKLDALFERDYIDGILNATERHNYRLMIERTGEIAGLERILLQTAFDGIISNIVTPQIASLFRDRCPFVFLGTSLPDSSGSSIIPDNHGGIRQAVEYLYGLGHRTFGFMLRDPEHFCFQERFRAFRAALSEHGLDFDQRWVHTGTDFERFAAQPRLPTAVVCCSDGTANQTIKALSARGIRIPADISVTGFDDIETARSASPAITTLGVPRPKMATIATEQLIDKIEGRRSEDLHIVVPVSLVIRESCCPPPAAHGAEGKSRLVSAG